MLIDLTRIERSRIESIKKYERHSQNILELIREAGLEDVTNYIAYGETFALTCYDELIDIRYEFKPRGYKKQVKDFIEKAKKAKPSHLMKSAHSKIDGYVEGNEKYSIFEMVKDMETFLEAGADIESDEEMQNAVATLDKYEGAIALKCDNLVKFQLRQKAMVKELDDEIKRLQERKAMFQKRVEKTEDMAKWFLKLRDEKKIETPTGTITTSKSKGLVITGQVPNKYIKTTITITLDELECAINPFEYDMWEDEEKEILISIMKKAITKETPMKKEITKAIKEGEKIDFAYLEEREKGVIK